MAARDAADVTERHPDGQDNSQGGAWRHDEYRGVDGRSGEGIWQEELAAVGGREDCGRVRIYL